MAQYSLSVVAGYVVTNDQKDIIIRGAFTLAGSGPYPAGGMPLDAVLLALPEAQTQSGVGSCQCWSDTGSGYIYQRIRSTGLLMVLQVPLAGSLVTAAPLQQVPSSITFPSNERIHFEARFFRNS